MAPLTPLAPPITQEDFSFKNLSIIFLIHLLNP